MFIELTRGNEVVGEKVLVNVEAIDAIYPFGKGTHVVFGNSNNINVIESYETVRMMLSDMGKVFLA